ncbi:MAG: hypothetical protein WBC69_06230 [Geitlerinemataceae cyanobacterium]
MLDFHTLSEFSRTHCVTICTFLVPANLLLTLATLSLTVLGRPASQVRVAAGTASLFALVMVLHVSTWFAIGVVQAETFILLSLGATCFGVNVWAIVHSRSMKQLGQSFFSLVQQKI